jgi:hypothetical protein
MMLCWFVQVTMLRFTNLHSQDWKGNIINPLQGQCKISRKGFIWGSLGVSYLIVCNFLAIIPIKIKYCCLKIGSKQPH